MFWPQYIRFLVSYRLPLSPGWGLKLAVFQKGMHMAGDVN